MQHKNITIRLINLAGEVLGMITLPASFRLIDLEPLKSMGAARLEVLQ